MAEVSGSIVDATTFLCLVVRAPSYRWQRSRLCYISLQSCSQSSYLQMAEVPGSIPGSATFS
jgi:hypothetical protein